MIKKTNTAIPVELLKLSSSSTFLSVKGYTNEFGEKSNFQIVFNIDYIKAVKKAIKIWTEYQPQSDLESYARNELIQSYTDTLNNCSRSTSASAYIPISDLRGNLIKGVKFHYKENAIHLFGFLLKKKVLIPGVYIKRNKRPLTHAKDRLRSLTNLSKFRQFKLVQGRFDTINVGKLSLNQKDLIKNV